MTYENYREPGEFGEGATVRRAEPAIDYRTCGTAELAAANPNIMNYVKEREDEIERLKQDRYRLAYAITGGEDAPGLLDSLPTDQLVEIARDNVARHVGDIDRLVALEETLREIAAYDDAAANAYLRATGSYRCFDEPKAVEMARAVLEGGAPPSPSTHLRGSEPIAWMPKERWERMTAAEPWLTNIVYSEDQSPSFACVPLYGEPNDRSSYEKGVRDGVEEALRIATDQARMMADLAIEGLPDNARQREAMEAALARFSQGLRVTLEGLATPMPSAVAALQAIADLPTPKNLDRMNGQEDAYRAVEGLFGTPPHIEATPPPQPREAGQ